jgi:hypothetical protein
MEEADHTKERISRRTSTVSLSLSSLMESVDVACSYKSERYAIVCLNGNYQWVGSFGGEGEG